jgi:hypothetical protein
MAERVTMAQRIKLRNIAETELLKYKDDHAAWHKHVHNTELDQMQVLKCIEMDEHPKTVDYSCRRTRKTSIKELFNLKKLSTQADHELGIVAPREQQSRVNLNYHLDAINRSPMLQAFIAFERGRRWLSDTQYKFFNRSLAGSYGIMGQIDGGDLTMASLEEVDDMPHDRLFSRFMPMLGGTQRLGAANTEIVEPEIRITGVFKGADTLSEMVNSGNYVILPTVDAYLGIEMGILHESFIMDMRKEMSPDEYIRQMLCKNISARNFIWTSWIRRAIRMGIKLPGFDIVEPMPGETYKKRGLVSMGYDHSGHGEDPQSSKYACVIVVQIGNYVCVIFARTWRPGTDETIVKNDLLSIYRYFRPDIAHGDSFGIGLLTSLNDDLYANQLTTINRHAIGDGASNASNWSEWAFSPIQFEGQTKHMMASAVKSAFSNKYMAMPYVDDIDPGTDPAADDMRLLQRQCGNIKAIPTSKAYQSYQMIKRSLGDDLFDAMMAAVWGLVTRGIVQSNTIIASSRKTRADMLGENTQRLPSDPILLPR